MTAVNFNELLNQAKSASFDALPNGDYDVEVTSAEATTASTGKPMIKCKFKVTTGQYANRGIFNQFVLSVDNPQALAMFFRHMKAFGLDESFFAQLGNGDLTPVASALVGRQARVTLSQREYQGEARNNVDAVKPIPGGAPAPGGLPGNAAPPAAPVAPTPPAAAAPAAPTPDVQTPAAPAPQQPAAPAPQPPAAPQPGAAEISQSLTQAAQESGTNVPQPPAQPQAQPEPDPQPVPPPAPTTESLEDDSSQPQVQPEAQQPAGPNVAPPPPSPF